MHRLAHGQLISLYPTHSSQIRVSRGRLWITTDDSPDDHFVHAGQMLALVCTGHVVLEAWSQNKLEVTEFDFVYDVENEAENDSKTAPASETRVRR